MSDHTLGAMYDVATLHERQQEAITRHREAQNLCDAAANQSYVVQAEATRDLTNAKAVCAEWCVPASRL